METKVEMALMGYKAYGVVELSAGMRNGIEALFNSFMLISCWLWPDCRQQVYVCPAFYRWPPFHMHRTSRLYETCIRRMA